MGIFNRFSDIISSNLNALLDKAENPEFLIAQMIREMETGLSNARRQGAVAIAAEHRIARELEQHRQQADFWKQKARQALVHKREDLAYRALARKREHDDLVQSLEHQDSQARQSSERVRTALRALEARLAEARRKQRSMLARQRATQVRLEVSRFLDVGKSDFEPFQAKFHRLENRLEELEDELEAQEELNHPNLEEAELVDLEREENIQKELETLRQELNPGKPEGVN